jgi:Sigma-70 region 2
MPRWKSRAKPRAVGKNGRALVPSREALLQACVRGDRAALQSLYAATAPQLFDLALSILRSRELAEDIVQDCFILAWRHAHGFDPRRGTAMASAAVFHAALGAARP